MTRDGKDSTSYNTTYLLPQFCCDAVKTLLWGFNNVCHRQFRLWMRQE